jgi:2-alkyl-3-oxoalkanoate reductase
MNRVLVTGATGFLGIVTVRRLLQLGIKVRALCRSAQKGAVLRELGAEVVAGDLQDVDSLRQCVQGCDTVFHVAATLAVASAAQHYNVNVLGSLNAIKAAHEGGALRFIHVSSIAVYGYNIHGRITEAHPHNPPRDDFYMQSKSLGELAVRDYAAQTDLPTVVIRPGFIYGEGAMFWSKTIYNIVRKYPMPLINGGTGHAHPIHVDDVVELMFASALHPAAPGNVFHATPDPAPTWAEFAGYYARVAGNDRVLAIPLDVAMPIARVLTLLQRIKGRPTSIAGSAKYMAHDVTFSMQNAADCLNFVPRVSLEAGMARLEPWLRTL